MNKTLLSIRHSWTVCAVALLSSVMLVGCQPAKEPVVTAKPYTHARPVHQAPVPRPREAKPAAKWPVTTVVGSSVQGRPIECQVFGNGGDVVLIMATIHGNEQAGTPLVRHLSRFLQYHPEEYADKTIVLMPVANPDGMVANSRHNINGIDLNRNFPAVNFSGNARHGDAALSEPESKAIYAVLHRFRPNRIVSIHQPLNCIDYDGPCEGLARAMGAVCDLPVKKLGSRPGSLGSYAGLNMETPIVTVEFRRDADKLNAAEMWQRYGSMLLTSIRYPNHAK